MTSREGDEAGPTARNPWPRMWGGVARRQLWAIAGVAAIFGGLALNWGWLTAVGAAPLLIGILPCAAMCALGLCMAGRGHPAPSAGSCGGGQPAAHTETSPSGGVQP